MFIRELGVFPLLLTLELTTHTKCRLKLISSLVKTKIREKKQSYVVRHNRVTIDRSSYSCSCTGHGTEVKGNVVIHSCSRKISDNLKQSLAYRWHWKLRKIIISTESFLINIGNFSSKSEPIQKKTGNRYRSLLSIVLCKSGLLLFRFPTVVLKSAVDVQACFAQ